MEQQYLGKVVWFNDAKDYGFIAIDKVFGEIAEKDIFFHKRNIFEHKSVVQGDTVSFDIKYGVKKRSAVRVIKISSYED